MVKSKHSAAHTIEKKRLSVYEGAIRGGCQLVTALTSLIIDAWRHGDIELLFYLFGNKSAHKLMEE